jgi:hypothetical protein
VIDGGQLLEGLVILGVELGCVFAATALVMRRWGRGLSGGMTVLAHAVVATSILLGIHVIPGALGILSRASVLAAAALSLLGAWLAARRRPAAPAPRRTTGEALATRESPLAWLPALLVVGMVTGAALVYLRDVFGTAPLGIDALTFHLPDVASWIRTGSLWQIDQFVPELANGNYPNNGDVLFLALVLPFKSALLVRAAMVPYLALTAIAIYAVARELGACAAGAVLFAAAPCAVPAIVSPALVDTQTDTLMLFGFAAGAAFLLRNRRSSSTFDLVLAGLALGISFGTKWYALPCVAAVLVLWIAARALGGAGARSLARHGALVCGLVLALGGFWLLRNLVESADPFFPLRIAPFGITVFDAPPDLVRRAGGFTVSDYLLSPHIMRVYILPALRDTVTWLGGLTGAATLAAGIMTGLGIRRSGVHSRDRLVLLVALGAVVMAGIYTITPYTALGPHNIPSGTRDNTRYLMPALVAGAPAAAWLATRLRGIGTALLLAVAALVPAALARSYHLHSAAPWIVGSLVFVAAGWWLLGVGRGSALTRPVRGVYVYGLLVLALAGAGVWAQSRFRYTPYANRDETVAWLLRHAPSGQTVGLAGVWADGLSPVFPAFGPRLGNRVAYVGPFVRHMLQQYTTERSFDTALALGGYRWLFIGLGYPDPRPSVPAEAWARAAGYEPVARSTRLVLFFRGRGV